jgi:hypothetical protein
MKGGGLGVGFTGKPFYRALFNLRFYSPSKRFSSNSVDIFCMEVTTSVDQEGLDVLSIMITIGARK